VRQLEWTNGRILAMLDALLDVPDDQQPIIVLAADEGPFPAEFAADERDFDWTAASPSQIERKYGILNAMHLPGIDPADAGFNDRSTPVNTFRYVMNAFFHADLAPLPDVSFLSPDYAHLYDFVQVERTDGGGG
jgi:hypothetical protein